MTKPAVLFIAFCCLVSAQNKPVTTTARALPPAEAKAAPAEAKAKSETLHFTVNWPSGLSLGEGDLISSLTDEGWSFSFKVDAAVPAFAVTESAKSKGTQDLCSTELVKDGRRGERKIDEKTTFDAAKLTATRKTGGGGGQSEMRINACAKDALTFIQYVRKELVAGRIPPAQSVYYGSAYQTRLQYTGTQKMRSGDEFVDADRLTATIRSSSKEMTVDLFFARDATRTPLLVQIPVAVGKFSVEFVR